MKDLLVHVLVKEIGVGVGLANDIADACTLEQLEAVTEYIKRMKASKHGFRVDNWDKYTIMMMTAFRNAELKKNKQMPAKSQQAPKSAIDRFLSGGN